MPVSVDLPNLPALDAKGLAQHGADWGDGVVLRAVSKGPGVAVPVRHPRNGGPVRRVLSGLGRVDYRGGVLYLTPEAAAAGQEFTLTVEV